VNGINDLLRFEGGGMLGKEKNRLVDPDGTAGINGERLSIQLGAVDEKN